jgi:hypothetical protein
MQHRLVIAGLAALLAVPAFVVSPADAAIAFTCDSVSGSAVLSPGLVHDARPQSLSSGTTAPAGPANLTLASTSDLGVRGTGTFTEEGLTLSADGDKVAFFAASTNLDPADTLSDQDAYVKDLVSGDIVLATASDAGQKANAHTFASRGPSLSADGVKVTFYSVATNLDPADTDDKSDIYVKNVATGDIRLASTSDSGVKANQSSWTPAISADGTKVAFLSQANNLDPADTDTVADIYVKDLTTGDIALANTSDTGIKANWLSQDPYLSADGTKIAFVSGATNLDAADTDDTYDVYVKNLTTGDIVLASASDTGVKANDTSLFASLSPDGTKVAFGSRATNLDPADTDTVADIYVKALVSGDITLASTSDAGIKGNNNSWYAYLSVDGVRLGFSSIANNLDPADTDGGSDAYVKDLGTGDLFLAGTSDTGVRGTGSAGGSPGWGNGSKVALVGANLDPADSGGSGTYVKELPTVPTSIAIGGCSNGNSGSASVVDIRSYGPRPLGCPAALGGTAGNDYADTMPILVGGTSSMTIEWASGPNSYGVAAAKAGPTGTQWRFRLVITASPGHDTPATNQYLPTAGSGFTKTRLQGKFDFGALDSFNCTGGTADPLSWLSLANNGIWVAKTS